jgi:hypothetical protein
VSGVAVTSKEIGRFLVKLNAGVVDADLENKSKSCVKDNDCGFHVRIAKLKGRRIMSFTVRDPLFVLKRVRDAIVKAANNHGCLYA